MDNAGNVAGRLANPRSTFNVAVADSTDPIAQVANPIAGATIAAAVRPITGTASDNASGVDRVSVLIQNLSVSPAVFWNGSVWTTTPTFVTANLNVPGTIWSVPNVDLTTTGNYRVSMVAVDNAGNVATRAENPISSFTVQ